MALARWEAEEARVRAAPCDVCVHQVEHVTRVQLEPLACDGLPLFVVLLVSAERWTFVVLGLHGRFVGARAVWVTAFVLDGHVVPVCYEFASEHPLYCGCLWPDHVCWVAWGYRVEPGREPCLLVLGDGGYRGVVVGGEEVQ